MTGRTKPSEGLKAAIRYFEWAERYLFLRAKGGEIVPYRMNSIQRILAQYVAWCWHNEIPVKVALPKSRQMGSSTFWQLLFFTMCELKKGYRVAVVAHIEEGAVEVFSRSQTCLRQLRARTDWPDPPMLNEKEGFLKWEWESTMQVVTIRTGDAAGKGGSPSAVHYSESASFSDRGVNAKKTVNSINSSRADTRWTIECHESTAKGKDPFYYPLCMDAIDPDSGSDYQLIFLPWFLDPGYKMKWADYRKSMTLTGKRDPGKQFAPTEEEVLLRKKLENAKVDPHETHYRYNYRLSEQQLIWRRWAIPNKCRGDMDEFKRYYPSFLEEAFTASANSMFSAKTVDWYRQKSKTPLVTAFMGEGVHNQPLLSPDKAGPLWVWGTPEEREDYVIGADPGGEKEGSDPCSATVMNRDTLDVVAHLHGHFEWDNFADMCYLLGIYYNCAELVMENNVRPAVALRLHRGEYPNLYYYVDVSNTRAGRGSTPGFNTNRKTRKLILDKIKRATRDRHLTHPDKRFWREMENFVWVPTSGSDNPDRDGIFKAVGKSTDDMIMSTALALHLCVLPEPELNTTPNEWQPSKSYRKFLELKEEWKESRRGRSFLDLGPRRV